MTGEGIHTAMIAAKLAAQTIQEMTLHGDFSADSCSVYHRRWMDAFGHDFKWSAAGAWLIVRFPIVLDAACAYGQRKGQAFLDLFGELMTGVQPKRNFLVPSIALPIAAELVKQMFLQYVLMQKPLIPVDIGQDMVDKFELKAKAAAVAKKES